ncbi:MAG: hypothetical protein B7X11_03065 [Acidobacteria bacterium 37-65-4]|nr:MAG: hypothetical protein B7X11_03065 [Acidobacteria bacterium 37-65-4]
MSSKGHAEVKVRIVGDQVVCDPDPVKCNWLHGPDNIRWTFKDLPANVASVVIEWKTLPMHRGMGHAPSTVGSHLSDMVTSGNVRVGGQYWYHVYCLDAKGALVAYADPLGQNEPPPV